MACFNQKTIKPKICLLNLAAELGKVSKVRKVMSLSRVFTAIKMRWTGPVPVIPTLGWD